MQIGFYTSTFNDRPIEEVLDFAKSSGFEAVEIDVGGHIKSPENVSKVVKAARDHGLRVSSIAFFGNQLEPDVAKRQELRTQTAAYAGAVAEAGVPILVIFPGRDQTAPEEGNYESFASHVNDMLSSTPSSALSIAIENWPGPNNDYIATTPAGWEKLLSLVTDRRFGLEFDPSHLLRVGVDPYRALEAVRDRVKILHAKDTAIGAKRLHEIGYHGEGWWRYTLPGSGKLDWPKFLRQAQSAGYDDVISIEHEDAEFGWPGKDLEARKEGERRALAYLRKALSA